MNGTTEAPATEPQLNYIRALLDERVMDEENRTGALKRLNENPPGKLLASRWIERLKQLPKKEVVPASAPPDQIGVEYKRWIETGDVGQTINHEAGFLTGLANPIPRGSYALPTPGATNEHTFYRLWIGDRYGWRLYLLHGPEQTAMNRYSAITVLRHIAENPAEAASRYGLLIGKCGVCSRRLTNDVSRERGIGPVCAERWGW